jgi:hypothetical protein
LSAPATAIAVVALLALAVALIAQAAGPIIAAQAISTGSRVAVPPRRGLGGGA